MADIRTTDEILVPIEEYVGAQRIETDLGKVQGYGLDESAKSVRFSLKPLAGLQSKVSTLETKTGDNERGISANTQEIGDLKKRVSGIEKDDLPEKNRKAIEEINADLLGYEARFERDENAIKDNADGLTGTNARVQRNEVSLADHDVRIASVEGSVRDVSVKVLMASKQVPSLSGYRAAVGEIVQFAGPTSSEGVHGGFYEWNGTEWVRLSVDDHTALEQKVKANTDAIATLNGGEQTSGSVRNTVLDYIGKAQHARFKVVDALPPVKDAESNVLYLVPFEGKEGVYKQYILADGRFVQLDNTEVDLSDYYTKHETDTAISDVADALTAKNNEQDTAISARVTTSDFNAYKTAQAATDKAQSDAIADLQKHKQVNSDWSATSGVAQILNKPNLHKVATTGSYTDLNNKPNLANVAITGSFNDLKDKPATNYVPFSDNLDSVSDDLGVAWMNTSKTDTSKEYGHLYKREQSGSSQVFWETFEFFLPHIQQWMNAVIMRPYNVIEKDGKKYYQYTDPNEYGFSHGWFECFENKVADSSGDIEFEIRNHGAKVEDISSDSAKSGEGGWVDVYDTATITADISAEVQRATQAEGALSTRIDSKADASTWSASLKNQIDADHTTLSGLSSKWTEILFSQIGEDHTTLGTLNTYLSEAKRTSIDNAISKSHTQNTDTMLNNGTLKVESNKISATLPIVSSGDIEGVGTDNKHHLLSKKMDSDKFRVYNSFADMVADTQRPAGAWCAIIE